MRNFFSEYKKPAVSAAVFFVTLTTLSYSYAAFTALTDVVTGQTLSKDAWNAMVANLNDLNARTVPQGAVMAFNLASCPTGWSAANGAWGRPDLRWEFIRGLDGGRGVDVWRWLATAQNATRVYQYNTTDIGYQGGLWDHDQYISADFDGTAESVSGGAYSAAISGGPVSSWTVYGVRVRPRNVALLYCVKD